VKRLHDPTLWIAKRPIQHAIPSVIVEMRAQRYAISPARCIWLEHQLPAVGTREFDQIHQGQ